jgi:hypothetical protein
MVKVPVYVPLPVGLAVTLIVHLLPAANVTPQVLPATKDAPLTCMLEMAAGTLPVLLTVTVWRLLVRPTFTLPKLRLVGDTLSVGDVAPAPVPVSGRM